MQYSTSHTIAPTDLLLLHTLLLCFVKRHSCFLPTSSLFHTPTPRPVVLTTSWSSSVFQPNGGQYLTTGHDCCFPPHFSILCKLITLPLQALYSRLYYRQRPQTNKPNLTLSNNKQLQHFPLSSVHGQYKSTDAASADNKVVGGRTAFCSVLGSSVPFTKPSYHSFVSATEVKNEWSLTCGFPTPT